MYNHTQQHSWVEAKTFPLALNPTYFFHITSLPPNQPCTLTYTPSKTQDSTIKIFSLPTQCLHLPLVVSNPNSDNLSISSRTTAIIILLVCFTKGEG